MRLVARGRRRDGAPAELGALGPRAAGEDQGGVAVPGQAGAQGREARRARGVPRRQPGTIRGEGLEAPSRRVYGGARLRRQVQGVRWRDLEALPNINLTPSYQVRRKVRSFCKWYTYIIKIVRMFDRVLHKEYVHLSYLRHFLKVEKIPVEAVDDKVEMRFYKLKREFEGSISLESGGGVLEPGSSA